MSSQGALRGGLGNLSAFIYSWTPMILLVCYCVIGFFFYLVIPPILREVLFYILLALQTFTALSVSTEAMQSIRPSVKARRAVRKTAKEGWGETEDGKPWPKIDIVLVAYLPNEQDIIMRQIRYALREINYPADKLMINLVYNTPKPIEPVETELRELEAAHAKLRVIKVPNSTSKADNINHYLSLDYKCDIITLYDTDHYPDPNAVRWVARRFLQGGIDIIQGRCCIYNYDETWVTRLVAAEFDMIYGVMHSGRAEMQGYGFFGGSNGHWNASLLKTLGMQKHMLTEDIDSSMRAIISGARIEYDLKVLVRACARDHPGVAQAAIALGSRLDPGCLPTCDPGGTTWCLLGRQRYEVSCRSLPAADLPGALLLPQLVARLYSDVVLAGRCSPGGTHPMVQGLWWIFAFHLGVGRQPHLPLCDHLHHIEEPIQLYTSVRHHCFRPAGSVLLQHRQLFGHLLPL